MQQVTDVSVTIENNDWYKVNWRKANRIVRQLRQRIFKATQNGEIKKVRSLQRLMLRSYSNVLLSVRKVTQDNQVCGESLFNDEPIDLHRIIPRSQGGKDEFRNLIWVHQYCHHKIHHQK